MHFCLISMLLYSEEKGTQDELEHHCLVVCYQVRKMRKRKMKVQTCCSLLLEGNPTNPAVDLKQRLEVEIFLLPHADSPRPT